MALSAKGDIMPNSKFKVIYSLRVHLALERQGFHYEVEMKNPTNPRFNCWVYIETPELLNAFDKLMKEGCRK